MPLIVRATFTLNGDTLKAGDLDREGLRAALAVLLDVPVGAVTIESIGAENRRRSRRLLAVSVTFTADMAQKEEGTPPANINAALSDVLKTLAVAVEVVVEEGFGLEKLMVSDLSVETLNPTTSPTKLPSVGTPDASTTPPGPSSTKSGTSTEMTSSPSRSPSRAESPTAGNQEVMPTTMSPTDNDGDSGSGGTIAAVVIVVAILGGTAFYNRDTLRNASGKSSDGRAASAVEMRTNPMAPQRSASPVAHPVGIKSESDDALDAITAGVLNAATREMERELQPTEPPPSPPKEGDADVKEERKDEEMEDDEEMEEDSTISDPLARAAAAGTTLRRRDWTTEVEKYSAAAHLTLFDDQAVPQDNDDALHEDDIIAAIKKRRWR